MNRIMLGILVGCLLTAPVVWGAPVDVEGITARNLGAVVLILGRRVDDGGSVQGSGCVIHPDGYILATAHQAEGVENLTAKFSDGTTVPLTLVEVHRKIEFALFKAAKALPRVVPIGDATSLRHSL